MTPTLIQQFIGNINNFNVIYLLTGGWPMNANYNSAGETDLLVTWLYKLVFGQTQQYNVAACTRYLNLYRQCQHFTYRLSSY
jgi:arabinogalactan oligomer/maltooligosaccharide transport system permease protein